MPESLYNYGGMIGTKLDFKSIEQYIMDNIVVNASSVAFVTSVVASATSVVIPITAQTGDVAILAHGGGTTASTPTPITPSGWSVIAVGNTYSTVAMGLYYKVLTSTDIGSTVYLSPTWAANRKILTVHRANVPLSSSGVSLVSVASEFTTEKPAPQTISISEVTSPVISFVNHYSSVPISVRSSSVTMNEIQGASSAHWFKYLTYNTNPQDITVDQVDYGSNTMISGGLSILGGVTNIYGNQKNSGIWNLAAIFASKYVAPLASLTNNVAMVSTSGIYSSAMVGINNRITNFTTITSPTMTTLNYTKSYSAGSVLIFAFGSATQTAVDSYSITDSAGSTFNRLVEAVQTNGLTVSGIFSATLTNNVTPSDTFTITTTGNNTRAIGITIYELDGNNVLVKDTSSLSFAPTDGTFSQTVNTNISAIHVWATGLSAAGSVASSTFTLALSNGVSGSSSFSAYSTLA